MSAKTRLMAKSKSRLRMKVDFLGQAKVRQMPTLAITISLVSADSLLVKGNNVANRAGTRHAKSGQLYLRINQQTRKSTHD